MAVGVTLAGGVPSVGQAAFPGANGRIAFQSGRDDEGAPEIYSINPDGSGPTRLTNNTAFDADPAWSPSGTRIAFSSQRTGNSDIFVMNADGAGQVDLSNTSDRTEFSPAWSPNGTKIAFVGQPSTFELFVMNADGTGVTQLTNDGGFDAFPAWSPDGTKIAFASNPGYPLGETDIVVINADGSGRTSLTSGPSDDFSPDWSPDGSKIVFHRDPSRFADATDIWVMNADGSGQTQLTNDPTRDMAPAWSPDGSKIVWGRGAAAGSDLYTMSPDGTGLVDITNSPGSDVAPDWQPIVSNQSPHCSGVTATPANLSPANRKLVPVVLTGATDPDGDPVTTSVTGVTQDEPTGGEPDAAPGSAPNQVSLRAERDGGGDGRVYRITFQASDGRGGTCAGTVKVGVPRGSRAAVDSAPPSYDSFGN